MDMSRVKDKIEDLEDQFSPLLIGSFLNPAPSCQLIPQGSPLHQDTTGFNAGTGYANLEYCDMTRRYCNSIRGWMSVANLDMTDTNQNCPSGFRLVTSPKRTCGTPGSRCVSTTFPLNGVKYSRVCGKIIGYVPIPLMHLIPTILFVVTQLTVSMLTELASLMIKDQGNIFGHL